jgi:TP901 family phage tail tape measure protein
MMNSVHQAAQYVKDLDQSLTNIMMVSGETRENMNAFAKDANEIAQRLGVTTVQMTEATKVFVQQGFNLSKSSQLGEYAVHLANVSEQDSATASDEITAYMNAFKIPLDDLGNAISK